MNAANGRIALDLSNTEVEYHFVAGLERATVCGVDIEGLDAFIGSRSEPLSEDSRTHEWLTERGKCAVCFEERA